MTVHAPQPPPPQPYLVPVNLTEDAVKELTSRALKPAVGARQIQSIKQKHMCKGSEADVKDTLLSEEGQQHGFRVCMALCYLS